MAVSPRNCSLSETPTKKKPTQNEIFPQELAQLTCRKHLDHEQCNTHMSVGSNFNDLAWQTHESLGI